MRADRFAQISCRAGACSRLLPRMIRCRVGACPDLLTRTTLRCSICVGAHLCVRPWITYGVPCHSLPDGRSGLVSRKSHSLFREIKSAISLFSGRLLDLVIYSLTFRFFIIADLTFGLAFLGCVLRFCSAVLFAPAAQRGRCPHALRAPLQGLLALDLGKGLTPPLATGVDVLHGALSVLCACGHFSLPVLCGFGGARFARETASA